MPAMRSDFPTTLGMLLFLSPLLPGTAAGQALAPGADVPGGTLVVAGMAAEEVWLLDLPAGTRRAVIPTRTAPHEVAASADGRTAVVTNYGGREAAGNLIQVLDVEAGTVVRELVVDGYERIHGAAFLPGDSLLIVTSERTGELVVVGTDDGRVRWTVPTGGRASHMLAPGGDWIYTANIVDGTVSRVDPSGEHPTLVWPAGTRTEGIAATPDGAEGWTGSMEGGDVVGIEGATGREVARIGGLQVPYRLAVTPDGATVVVTDPEAEQLVLVDRSAGTIRARIDVGAAAEAVGEAGGTSPQGFALSPDGRWAFVSTKGIDRVTVVDLAAARVVGFLDAPAGPDGIAFVGAPGDP